MGQNAHVKLIRSCWKNDLEKWVILQKVENVVGYYLRMCSPREESCCFHRQSRICRLLGWCNHCCSRWHTLKIQSVFIHCKYKKTVIFCYQSVEIMLCEFGPYEYFSNIFNLSMYGFYKMLDLVFFSNLVTNLNVCWWSNILFK